ncbi:toxin CcdB [Halomonas alkaliantarctica]|nr:toxin CcdB [Halomonas alkaliantarctica]
MTELYNIAAPQKAENSISYLVDSQSGLLTVLATRIVIPLGKHSTFGNQSMRSLTPEISFEEQQVLLVTPQISSVPEKYFKNPIDPLSHCRAQIVEALDFAVERSQHGQLSSRSGNEAVANRLF